MRKRVGGSLVLAVVVTAAADAAVDAGAVVRARQAEFKTLLDLHRAVRRELMRPAPSPAIVVRAADQELLLAGELTSWFPAGAGPQRGVQTDAKAAIWTHPADFQAKAGALSAALAGLDSAARSGDTRRMRARQAAVADACQACHETYLDRF